MTEKLILEFLEQEGIEYYAALDIAECSVIYPRKLPEYTQCAVFFLVPYYVRDEAERNVSLYAVPRDYHLYFSRLSEKFSHLSEDIPSRIFADNSPFNERECAVRAGLGTVGKNRLLAIPRYGSYVFIGSICLPFKTTISHLPKKFKDDLCGNCEKCLSACPFFSGGLSECLSAITQKKTVTADEEKAIRAARLKWGCDICQTSCPKNAGVEETPIEFFKVERIPYLNTEAVSRMSEEEFSQRAYAWRKREVIQRNLKL